MIYMLNDKPLDNRGYETGLPSQAAGDQPWVPKAEII